MTTAYLVSAHEDLEGLVALAETLAPAPVIIHLDRRFHRRSTPEELSRITATGALLIDDPVCVHWGGYSLHVGMIAMLRLALRVTDAQHFSFISGRCFPVRDPREFEAYLAANPELVLCRAFPLSEGITPFMNLDRAQLRHFLDGPIGHLRKWSRPIGGGLRKVALAVLPRRVNQDVAEVYCGSNWVTVPRALADELVVQHDAGWFDFLTDAFGADELTLPTYIHSTEWGTRTVDGGPIPGRGRLLAECANVHWLRRSLQGSVRRDEVEEAIESGAYFIRKMPEGEEGRELRSLITKTWETVGRQ